MSAADYRGTTRSGGNVAALGRASSDTATLWAATTTGRVFISKNADTTNTSVTYTRLDSLAANSPGRFISGIVVDPADSNHAWISYSSYSSLDPTTPGHVFSVTFNPGVPSATWTSLDGSGMGAFPDFPATGIAYDSVTGDLYVSNDWGVLRLAERFHELGSCWHWSSQCRSCRAYDRAECAKALRCDARAQRLATDIAINLG